VNGLSDCTIKVLVSACLVGEPVRYDGKDARCPDVILEKWRIEGRLVPICPEVAGGLPVPRTRSEIQGHGGSPVLEGATQVLDESGRDVTSFFLAGAKKALQSARDHGLRFAILKEGSPSCGSGSISDGNFAGTRKRGRGVTTALLEREGIRVFSELELRQAADFLETLQST